MLVWSNYISYRHHLQSIFLCFSPPKCPPNVHKLDGYMCDAGQVIHFGSLSFMRMHAMFSHSFLTAISLSHSLRVVAMVAAARPETGNVKHCGDTVSTGSYLSVLRATVEKTFCHLVARKGKIHSDIFFILNRNCPKSESIEIKITFINQITYQNKMQCFVLCSYQN